MIYNCYSDNISSIIFLFILLTKENHYSNHTIHYENQNKKKQPI